VGCINCGLVVGQDSGLGKEIDIRFKIAAGRGVVAVESGERLDDLGAPAMAMHIAEPANIHEDVEPQGRTGVKGAKCFVVTAAVPQSKLNHFGDASRGKLGDHVANLAVRVMCGGVEQRRSQLNFEGLRALNQVDEGGFRDGQSIQNLARSKR
jgi:hypothetical protein